MQFGYASSVSNDFPELATGVLRIEGITASADVSAATTRFCGIASARLGEGSEAELPEIQGWRQTFAKMGLKPTQYRCASEALLRRFRKDRTLPSIHPFVDLCNSISIAFAIPIAVFDLDRISGDLEVRYADGSEIYETFSSEIEHPETGEVIFADRSARAHARRWTNRQSGHSAIRNDTDTVLVVAEAMHGTAAEDVARLTAAVSEAVAEAWPLAAILKLQSR